MRIEAVAQLAGQCGASLDREGQCGLENLRGSARHALIVAARTTRDTDNASWSVHPLEPSNVELLTPPRGSTTNPVPMMGGTPSFGPNLNLVGTASDPIGTILRDTTVAVSVRSVINGRESFTDARKDPIRELMIEEHSRGDQLAHERAGALDQPFLLRARTIPSVPMTGTL